MDCDDHQYIGYIYICITSNKNDPTWVLNTANIFSCRKNVRWSLEQPKLSPKLDLTKLQPQSAWDFPKRQTLDVGNSNTPMASCLAHDDNTYPQWSLHQDRRALEARQSSTQTAGFNAWKDHCWAYCWDISSVACGKSHKKKHNSLGIFHIWIPEYINQEVSTSNWPISRWFSHDFFSYDSDLIEWLLVSTNQKMKESQLNFW